MVGSTIFLYFKNENQGASYRSLGIIARIFADIGHNFFKIGDETLGHSIVGV